MSGFLNLLNSRDSLSGLVRIDLEDVKGISKGKGGASYVVFSRGSGG